MDKSRTSGEWEQDYLRSQCESTDNVQYLAMVYGEIIGTEIGRASCRERV